MKKARASKGVYEEAVKKENIYNMWQIIKRTCKNKKEVFNFSLNLNTNIEYIYNMLKEKRYIPKKYRTFMIFEPKARLVMSQTVTDKIVNHFVTNYFLIPYLDRILIDSNVATRVDKGSGYAMELVKKYLNKLIINNKNKEIYCLKIDISKYFYSIDHNILLSMLEKRIKDKDVINLIKVIIYETNSKYINKFINRYNEYYKTDIPLYKEHKGLSIGAMSSQFLAIFYLNEIDHFIKEKLKCNYYIRYMDDFVILDNDKERLNRNWKLINGEINKLKLVTNKKSNIYRVSKGFLFLGYKYKISNNRLIVSCSKETFYRIRKKLDRLYKKDKVKYNLTLASYKGYIMRGSTLEKKNFKMKITEIYKSYKDKYPDSIILIKDKAFYKIFFDDAKVLWNIFNYKVVNKGLSIGSITYDKTIDRLSKMNISFVVISNNSEVLSYTGDKEVYREYLKVSVENYDKFIKKTELIKRIEKLLDNKEDSYEKISSFLDRYV